MSDWADEMFPGDGLEKPTDDERDRADALIAEWAARWREEPRTVARTRVPRPGTPGYAIVPTNRAFLRSQLRRWWRGTGVPVIVACGECRQPAIADGNGRPTDTVGGRPMCASCLNDYLAEAGADYRVADPQNHVIGIDKK